MLINRDQGTGEGCKADAESRLPVGERLALEALAGLGCPHAKEDCSYCFLTPHFYQFLSITCPFFLSI